MSTGTPLFIAIRFIALHRCVLQIESKNPWQQKKIMAGFMAIFILLGLGDLELNSQ